VQRDRHGVGEDDDSDPGPFVSGQLLPEDAEARECGKDRVDAHEDGEEARGHVAERGQVCGVGHDGGQHTRQDRPAERRPPQPVLRSENGQHGQRRDGRQRAGEGGSLKS
jgi:hypothetical protein